jgi:serine/threonine protein kinase
MTLATGMKLGSYEIVAPLGAGGMGEVYRAHDTKLGREVAIKILPEAFSRDVERLARFQREAQVLASLNHPHIAAIYNLVDREPSPFLILELVEGETLADRIQRGRIPTPETLRIASHGRRLSRCSRWWLP